VLDALVGDAWRARAATHDGAHPSTSVTDLLSRLAGDGSRGGDSVARLAPDTPASLVVLRPASRGATRLEDMRLETVLLEGRTFPVARER
jgi:hypothetical protein